MGRLAGITFPSKRVCTRGKGRGGEWYLAQKLSVVLLVLDPGGHSGRWGDGQVFDRLV